MNTPIPMSLTSPETLRDELPITPRAQAALQVGRHQVQRILRGLTPRRLAILGPGPGATLETLLRYAHQLKELRKAFEPQLCLCLRFDMTCVPESASTVPAGTPMLGTVSGRGCDLRALRRTLLEVAALGVPVASELMDPIVPHYVGELVSWAVIGSGATESPTHRQLASSLPVPVGFYARLDGATDGARNAIVAASRAQRFVGIGANGRVALVTSQGNPDGHLVLRGKAVHASGLGATLGALASLGIAAKRVLVDCAAGRTAWTRSWTPAVAGVLLHSQLATEPAATSQEPPPASALSLQDTLRLLRELARGVHTRTQEQRWQEYGLYA